MCQNVPELVQFIAEERDLDLANCMLKFGTDNGKGKLKAGQIENWIILRLRHN